MQNFEVQIVKFLIQNETLHEENIRNLLTLMFSQLTLSKPQNTNFQHYYIAEKFNYLNYEFGFRQAVKPTVSRVETSCGYRNWRFETYSSFSVFY